MNKSCIMKSWLSTWSTLYMVSACPTVVNLPKYCMFGNTQPFFEIRTKNSWTQTTYIFNFSCYLREKTLMRYVWSRKHTYPKDGQLCPAVKSLGLLSGTQFEHTQTLDIPCANTLGEISAWRITPRAYMFVQSMWDDSKHYGR